MRDEAFTLFRAAGWSAYVSAVVSAFGIVFLVLLYVGFFAGAEGLLRFGPLNDICGLIQYALALPIAVAFHRILRAQSPGLRLVAMLIGVIGIVGFVVFQSLLITGVMPFSEQIAYASASGLTIGVWIVITGLLARRSGRLHISVAVIILGALCFGYPLWAYRVGQQLLSGNRTTIE